MGGPRVPGTALSAVCWALLQHPGVAPGPSAFTDNVTQVQRTEVPEQAKEWEPRMNPNLPDSGPARCPLRGSNLPGHRLTSSRWRN